MPNGRINITPKRSVALLAFLAILTIGASYLLLLLLAVGCIYLPYLLLLTTQIMAVQVVLLFLGGIAVAATMLHLLGITVSLILLEKGWKVHIQPAVLQFSRDGETLNAFGLVNDLLVGTLSPEDWVQKCLHLGIAEETLAAVKAQTVPTAPSA